MFASGGEDDMSGDLVLPRWEWDEKAGVLVPKCPSCGGVVRADGTKFTCLIMGFSHLHEQIPAVLDETQRRLAEP